MSGLRFRHGNHVLWLQLCETSEMIRKAVTSPSEKLQGKSLGVDDLTDLLQKGKTEVLKGFTAKIKRSFRRHCLKQVRMAENSRI